MTIIASSKSLKRLREAINDCAVLAFDTETTGLERDRTMVGWSVASRTGGWYVAHDHAPTLFQEYDNVPHDESIALIRDFLTNPAKTVYIHNAKFDVATLRNHGIDPHDIRAEVRDTMVISWMVNPLFQHGLKFLVKRFLQYEMTEFAAFKAWGGTRHVPVQDMAPYAVDDVVQLYKLAKILESKLDRAGGTLQKVFTDLLMPMVFVTEEMEAQGMRLEGGVLRDAGVKLRAEALRVENSLQELLGEGVKIGSSQWMSRTLIERKRWWGIPPEGRGKSGNYSTAKNNLEKWAAGSIPGTTDKGREAAQIIRKHRKVGILISTFTDTLADRADKADRVHGRFKVAGTRTGRMSSAEPNLQNIPRPPHPDDPNPLPNIRAAFVARDGFRVGCVDYSQVELRLGAHFTQDPVMLRTYWEDGDIHQETADACSCSRQDAKVVNFGVWYGMGEDKLAMTLGCTVEQARKFLARYFRRFARVKPHQQKVIRHTRERGYVSTLIGRRRYLPNINARDWLRKGKAERQAVNTQIQGSAADLINVAMRNIDREIKARGWYREHVYMLSQVHDELVFEVRKGYEQEVAATVKDIMENSVQIRVPLVADMKFGRTWAEAK